MAAGAAQSAAAGREWQCMITVAHMTSLIVTVAALSALRGDASLVINGCQLCTALVLLAALFVPFESCTHTRGHNTIYSWEQHATAVMLRSQRVNPPKSTFTRPSFKRLNNFRTNPQL